MHGERPLGVTVVGISLLHPAICIFFEPVILSFKLALCGAFIVFSIGIMKAKRSAYYFLIFMAIFGTFQAGGALLDLSRQSIFFKKAMVSHSLSLIGMLIYDIAVLIVLSRPKAIDFFYPELNKAEDKSAS